MNLHTAKCVLMDAISYERFRKDEKPPKSISDEAVSEAIELVWEDTFGKKMEWYDKAMMGVELNETDLQEQKKLHESL